YDGSYWYAELSKDPNSFDYTTLGGLEYKQILKITYKGKTAYAYSIPPGYSGAPDPICSKQSVRIS
ncbi:MAG: hypothetical protein IJK59_11505, partial [Firmicutes bacterium]|nr:hypothetical protein [Bacillota bacterium]